MFNPKIREYRDVLKLTQDQLSEISGVSQNYISNLENEKYNAIIAVLILICRALNTNPNDILNWEQIESYNMDDVKLFLNENLKS